MSASQIDDLINPARLRLGIKRAFTGDINEILSELFGNSQRAGARNAQITTDDWGFIYQDDGRGLCNKSRSNHSIFLPQNFGSPFKDTAEHITGLGLARIDFERCAVAGEVIYSVEGDSTPTSQQDEESRIATLAHALKKLGDPEDAAEFMR